MSTFDDATRARVAAGWNASGMDQASYALLHGIRPRTLRLWREQSRKMGVTGEPAPCSASASSVEEDALRARLAVLDEALAAARAAVAACRASLDAVAACRSIPGAVDPPVDVHDAGGMPDLVRCEDERHFPEGPSHTMSDGIVTPRVCRNAQPLEPSPCTASVVPVVGAAPPPQRRRRHTFFDDFVAEP